MATSKRFVLAVVIGALATTGGFGTANAQREGTSAALEEIVVTAQRREQSLQEVPISIETVSGLEIQRQGFRDLNELANFSPSIYIDDAGYLSQDRSIRGFGTSGNALTLEQAVPIFVDGIHFGRPAQVKLAFMDPARVEVLKGPQPVFFGMNATAGAFNIISAGPTPEWEGYADAEYGNNSTAVLNAAIGGPLSETVGIRVAAKYESADGFIKDVVTGDDLGGYENIGSRVILEFKPRDNLQLTFKAEYSEIDKDNEATVLCLTDGTLVYNRNQDGTPAPPGQQGNERSIWAPPPQGVGWSNNYQPLTTNCASDLGDTGISNGGPFYAPPENIREENMNFGAIDARAAADEWIRIVGINDGLDDTNETVESNNGYVNLAYQFGNDIEFNWQTGWSVMDRANSRDNSNSPFLMNYQNRGEDFDQYSSELRFNSGADGIDLGGINMEWMAGFLWQKTDLDFISNSPRPNVRRGLRGTRGGEDQEWRTLFASVTFNFMDGKASVDLGGRYTDLEKIGFIRGFGAQWVYDVRPCNYDVVVDELNPPPADPATCSLHPDAQQITAAETEFLLPGADTSNLWILPFGESRNVPLSWIGSRASAIGLSTLGDPEGNGPYGPGRGGDFDAREFDPQITLRFRPNENHSLFLRYAETFKAGGFDTGVTTVNDFCNAPPPICSTPYDNFRFEPESGDTIELGSKGTLWDGRARYDVTLFETTFQDFQITVATGDPDDPFLNKNAGEQRVRGLEFSLVGAVSEQLTLSFAGALMDGEFLSFPDAGCTETELANADTGPCISAAESLVITLERFGVASDDLEGTIDRSGFPAPKTPDWKFVLGLDYEVPVASNYVASINARGYISDGFITDINGFSETVKMNQHEDLNLSIGFGPQDGNWEVAAFGRNLLEAKEEYNPEFDLRDNGIAGYEGTDGGVQMSRSNYRSYGLKFRYNFH